MALRVDGIEGRVHNNFGIVPIGFKGSRPQDSASIPKILGAHLFDVKEMVSVRQEPGPTVGRAVALSIERRYRTGRAAGLGNTLQRTVVIWGEDDHPVLVPGPAPARVGGTQCRDEAA